MPNEFKFDSLEDAHTSIQEKNPEPNMAAIQAHTQETQEKTEAISSMKDDNGTVFDPEIHATNKDGEPSLTSTGKFRKKKGASKIARKIEMDPAAKEAQAARAAGRLAADMLVVSATSIGGPEWQPVGMKDGQQVQADFNEHENLRKAFADYFEAKGISDFPPGIALTIAVSAYAVPRLTTGKETKTRLAKAKIWFSELGNKFKKKGKDNAQPDTRDDGKRQNDTSEKPSATEPPKATRGSRS